MHDDPNCVKFIISRLSFSNNVNNIYSNIEELCKNLKRWLELQRTKSEQNIDYQIGVTSDIESIRYVASIIHELPNYIDNIIHIEKYSLDRYISIHSPQVSIVNPVDMFNKLKFFYENRKEISIENKKFQKKIQQFSEKNIFNKLQKILNENI